MVSKSTVIGCPTQRSRRTKKTSRVDPVISGTVVKWLSLFDKGPIRFSILGPDIGLHAAMIGWRILLYSPYPHTHRLRYCSTPSLPPPGSPGRREEVHEAHFRDVGCTSTHTQGIVLLVQEPNTRVPETGLSRRNCMHCVGSFDKGNNLTKDRTLLQCDNRDGWY